MTKWVVEKSYKVQAPEFFEVKTYKQLRQSMQALADTYRPADDAPALGKLFFQFDQNAAGVSEVARAYFRDRHGKKARFMRVRRQRT